VELLTIIEVDARGDRVLNVIFDADALDAAYAELDQRYAEDEAAPYIEKFEVNRRVLAAIAAHDWNLLSSGELLTPDFVLEDHRPIGAGILSRDESIAFMRAMVELRPDAVLRTVHVLAINHRGGLFVSHWSGDEASGQFEIPSISFDTMSADGRMQRWDIYDWTQLDQACAQFAALGASAASALGGDRETTKAAGLGLQIDSADPLAALAKPNAATAAMDRVQAAFAARDWSAMRAVCAVDATIDDRRQRGSDYADVDTWIADWQRVARAANARYERHLVSVVGDRLALERCVWREGRADESGERQHLWLAEIDEGGRIVAGIAFDSDDRRAAYRELNARWFAIDPSAEVSHGPGVALTAAFNDRDRVRLRACLADGLVIRDHRPARLGVVEGADAYVAMAVAWWDLAPDVQLSQTHVLAQDSYGEVGVTRAWGTSREGGAFEVLMIGIGIVANGQYTRLEVFDIEDVDRALARFTELGAERNLPSPGGSGRGR
jgi:hypothetical protein